MKAFFKLPKSMKIKILLTLLAALILTTPSPAQEQTSTNGVSSELRELVKQVREKISADKTTEADLAPELKSFDAILAKHSGEKNDELSQVLYMKAMLYLEVIKDFTKGKELVEKLKTDFPDTKLGKNADKILESIEKQAAAAKIQGGLAAGATFPDFNVKSISGEPLSVGGYKGKVVLVDFWATWCGPCRAELPNVIETYKKYHDKGFEIIGVSLDSDRDKLDAFLKKQDGMTWQQFFDGQGWGNELAKKYGVESIPFTVLIGPDGKIIGKDLRGDALATAVSSAVDKK